MHFAYSRDGGNFTALNNNTPVLRGPDGMWSSVRDPFMARDPNDAGVFHIVATAGGFARGIHVVHYWNMTLTTGAPVFSPPVLLDAMGSVNGTQECWAPEWTWDEEKQLYMVFFASETPRFAGGKSIWAVHTRDFASVVGAPFPLLAPNFSVIDANILRIGESRLGSAQMFFKDESYNRPGGVTGKSVKHIGFDGRLSPLPPSGISSNITQPGTEGPELVYFPSNGFGVGKYLLYYDCYTSTCFGLSTVKDCAVEGTCPANCTDCFVPVSPCADPPAATAATGDSATATTATTATTVERSTRIQRMTSFPNMARHGSFTPITEAELAVLLKAYPTTELQDCHGGPENKTLSQQCVPY